ncbi:putative radical SAM superfamily protein [Rhizobium pisi]|jgi:hypothetical protein|uniref:DUF2783 domain-containing protein n=1 Tax=Rhizobium pisi TaxID=574561 RepID=A0A3R9BKI7_9HYPH|nr:DUF2783 domain-containing protein [Rhizobium pisi]NTJ64495.1 DUF2783 domain-containing protein [Rhizobium rhizogenes]MBB3138936.1 putative radical SAM superfamily protein [Rhizobium pisi]NTJ78085.1 DUF2783 domain-containing protein [Rhizobium rhizogenes]RSB60429.1 DUF2783 domain-containing protein [Rhizobium pisi]TCA42616.1 DUF2783 domain-containing protein [Rhizobium pisi]
MLETKPNFSRPDETYAMLIKTHEGLTDEESQALNARLILILLNQVGDYETIGQALALARSGIGPEVGSAV